VHARIGRRRVIASADGQFVTFIRKKLKIWGGALNLQTKKDQRLENAGPRE